MYLNGKMFWVAVISTALTLACVDGNGSENECDKWYCGQCGPGWGYCDQGVCIRPVEYLGWRLSDADMVRIESSCSDYGIGGSVEECRGWTDAMDCYGGWSCERCFRDVCIEADYTPECHGGIDTED